jgi:hypothetical protein
MNRLQPMRVLLLTEKQCPQGLKRVCENSLVFLRENGAKRRHVKVQAIQPGSGLFIAAKREG